MRKAIIFTIFIILLSAVFLSVISNDRGREEIKKILQKAVGFIYREAEIHNPEGDVLPDQVDDIIKEEIKKKIDI